MSQKVCVTEADSTLAIFDIGAGFILKMRRGGAVATKGMTRFSS